MWQNYSILQFYDVLCIMMAVFLCNMMEQIVVIY